MEAAQLRLHPSGWGMSKTLHTDGEWTLKTWSRDGVIGLQYWISHQCEGGKDGWVERHISNLTTPCSFCGAVGPINLQGLYLMLEYL